LEAHANLHLSPPDEAARIAHAFQRKRQRETIWNGNIADDVQGSAVPGKASDQARDGAPVKLDGPGLQREITHQDELRLRFDPLIQIFLQFRDNLTQQTRCKWISSHE
jgi:hypothetical protein